MRPPILQWKVMLALLAVVIVGASLGSALHSTGSPHRTFDTRTFYSYGQLSSPTPINPCKDLKTKLRTTSQAERRMLRLFRRTVCRKHG